MIHLSFFLTFMLFLWHAHRRLKRSQSWTVWRWKESSRISWRSGRRPILHPHGSVTSPNNSPKINCKNPCLVGEGELRPAPACYRGDPVPGFSLPRPVAISERFSIIPDMAERQPLCPRCLSTSQSRATQKAHQNEGCPRYLCTDMVPDTRSLCSGPQAFMHESVGWGTLEQGGGASWEMKK